MWKIYIQKKVQEYININPLTCLSYLSLPHSSPPFSYLYHTFFPFTLSLIFHMTYSYSLFSFLPLPPTTSSLQSKQSSSYSDRDTTEDDSESLEDMDFLSRQKKLQAEAKLALAMAKPMAKMQVEVEKQNRKKSPVADLVSTRNLLLILPLTSQTNRKHLVLLCFCFF